MKGQLELFSKDNLLQAWESVLKKRIRKKYHAKELKAYSEHLEDYIEQLHRQLTDQTYISHMSQCIDKKKSIYLFSIEDTLIAYIIKDFLVEQLTEELSRYSYAYQKNRSIFKAVDSLKNAIINKDLYSYIKIDLKDFFGTINLEKVMKLLEKYVIDDYILKLIKQLIYTQYPKNGNVMHHDKGLLKGNPLSPLLSNLYMTEFDNKMGATYTYCRYSDDIFIALSYIEEEEVLKIYHQIVDRLRQEELIINKKKTAYGLLSAGTQYLGCHIQTLKDHELSIALRALLGKIDEETMMQYMNTPLLVSIGKLLQKARVYLSEKEYSEVVLNGLETLANQYVIEEHYQESTKILELIRLYQENSYTHFMDQNIFNQWVRLFDIKRRGVYLGHAENGFKIYKEKKGGLTFLEFCKTQSEKKSIACPLIYMNQIKYIVFDVDIDKKILLEHSGNDILLENMMKKALTVANTIKEVLLQNRYIGYIESSGYKGYHIWLFFQNDIEVEQCRSIQDLIREQLNLPNGVKVEYLPTMLEEEKELIKLPYTWHEITHKKNCFIDEKQDELPLTVQWIKGIQLNTLHTINHKVFERKEEDQQIALNKYQNLEDFPEYIQAVLKQCNLINSIVQKGIKENYLTHFERNALLYIFGHMGNVGHGFIHYVIKKCINYNFIITEGFIDKIREYPVSCQKLILRFPEIAERCICEFKRYPLFYPSPVIYGYELDADQVTAPDYVEHKKRIHEMVTVQHTYRIETLTKQMMEALKEQQLIEERLKGYKKELSQLFKEHGYHYVDTEYGRLVQQEDQWLIKLRM